MHNGSTARIALLQTNTYREMNGRDASPFSVVSGMETVIILDNRNGYSCTLKLVPGDHA